MASRAKTVPEPRASRGESRANGDYGEDAARRAEAAAAQAAQDRDEAARLLAEARQEREVAEDVAAGGYEPLYDPRVPPRTLASSGPTPYDEPTQTDLTLDAWQDRLDQLEPEGGVYVRVNRMGEGGERSWIGNLTDPQGPIEEEIERVAQGKGHTGASVRFLLQPVSRRTKRYVSYRDGRSSAYELTLAIAPAPPASTLPAAAVAVDPLLGAKTIVETAQALTPKAVAGADPVELATKMLAVLRPGESLSDKLLGMLVTALPTLKDLFAPKPSPLENAMAEFVKQRFARELGGEDDRPDLVDEVDKFRAVVEVLKPLVGGGAGEPRTVGLALLETLPEVVRHLAAPLDKFADAYRWRVMHGVAAPSAPVAAGAVPALPPAVAGLWRDVEGAARLNDHGFFPVLLRRLGETFQGGTEFLAAVRAGQVSDAQGLEQFRVLGGADTPATRQYLVTFFNWLRADRVATPAAAPPPGEPRVVHEIPPRAAGPIITTASPNGPGPQPGVVGRCEGCGDEIDFDDEPTFQARGGEPCEACGGRVVRS